MNKQELERLKAQAVEQRDKYLRMLHEANGAIGVINLLLSQLDKAEESGDE